MNALLYFLCFIAALHTSERNKLTELLFANPKAEKHQAVFLNFRMVWLPDGEKNEDTITRFDRIHERDRRTDRHRMTA